MSENAPNTNLNKEEKDTSESNVEKDLKQTTEVPAKKPRLKEDEKSENENPIENKGNSGESDIDESSANVEDSDGELADDETEGSSITQKSAGELRKFRRIPVYVVEYHNDALHLILDSVGSRFLPLKGNTLLHFDSHPDMVITRDLSPKDALDKTTLLDECSIESWIMPLCYTGIITRIIWIKYPWCKQIPTGEYKFNIGDYKDTMHVDLAIPYFLSEGTVCDTSQLLNKRTIELIVKDAFIDVNTYLKDDPQQSYILDIDLDFFSTKNPFLALYSKFDYYKELQEIFSLDIEDLNENNITEINEKRLKKLKFLKKIFKHLSEKNGNLKNFKIGDHEFAYLIPSITNFIKKMLEHYKNQEIDWMQVNDAGCTSDTGGLPFHVSTTDELEDAFNKFSHFIRNLPYNPILITISRSSEDEYCPSDQVEHIQDCVLKILNNKFELNKPIRGDQSETYDIMKL